jgi:hypothetical protein
MPIGGEMTYLTFSDFATITSQIIGELDELKLDAKPWPWFCRNIFREKDLQWTGSQGQKALALGLNLEFTPAWRRIYPKIKNNPLYFSRLLGNCHNFEWHWKGRPGMIAKDPPTKYLTPVIWVDQVDLTKWMSDIEDILDKRKMWSSKVPMRPQLSIMRQVGAISQVFDSVILHQSIQKIVDELDPLIAFLGK